MAEIAISISFIALISSLILYFRQRRNQIYDRLSMTWHNIINISSRNPQFFDISVTEQYHLSMNKEELVAYEPFCLMVWGLVEELISHGFHKHNELAPILQWAIAYHIAWLDRNPLFFRKREFWAEINNLRTQPQSIARYSPTPMLPNGLLNWDEISENYFDYILSPFDDLMFTESTRNRGNTMITALISKIQGLSHGKEYITLMDLGCGIGNLYRHLNDDICKKINLIAVDQCHTAIEKARVAAGSKFREAAFHEWDFTGGQLLDKYGENSIDIIVCICSLSLPDLASVNKALNNIEKLLARGGFLFTVLPSFEAVEGWLNLWLDYYKKEYGEDQAARIRDSWMRNKKFNKAECIYAEDGNYSQCFFTKAMINDLFVRYHGLTLIQEPQEIYYPWELIKRFDYGMYMGTSFELYDWQVIGRKD